MIVSPSAIEFMSTSLYGAPNYRVARPQLHKPATIGDDDLLRRPLSRHDHQQLQRQCRGVRADRDLQAADCSAALVRPSAS